MEEQDPKTSHEMVMRLRVIIATLPINEALKQPLKDMVELLRQMAISEGKQSMIEQEVETLTKLKAILGGESV